MQNTDTIKHQARANTREILARSASFATMSPEDQQGTYKSVYEGEYTRLMNDHHLNPADSGNAQALSTQSSLANQNGGLSQGMVASDLIDDQRHLNRRIDQAGDLISNFVQDVDFPQFVSDLLEGVFDANLKVTISQMQTYTDLLKEATKSLTEYVNKIDDDEAFARLVERRPNEFGMNFIGETASLTDGSGQPVNTADAEVRAKIIDAKLELARERRALLRETVLMGISRLVVEKGTVKANVSFAIRAAEQIAKGDQADEHMNRIRHRWQSRRSGWWGGRVYTHQGSTATNRITVATTDSTAATDLSGTLSGSVEIQFKSDYFKLDNFASMYGNLNQQGQQGQAGQQPPALPQA
jgi:hypothetical protein